MMDYDRGPPPRQEEPDEGGGSIDGECVLVPEGEYELRYVDYETATYFGTPKVVVHFAIVVPEEYAGLPVDRFYNAERLKGPPGRYGRYKAGKHGSLVREFRQLVGRASRTDRISFARLKGKRIIGEIETVDLDYQRNPLPEHGRYSRISKLVSALPDDDW